MGFQTCALPICDDPKRLCVAFETSISGSHKRIQHLLGSVTKGRVTEVVRQTGSFDRVRIDAADDFASLCILSQFLGQRTTNLRYLERMREAIVENVSVARRCDLRNLRETPESRCINDPVLVLLGRTPVITFLNDRTGVSAKIPRDFDVVIINHLAALSGWRNLM